MGAIVSIEQTFTTRHFNFNYKGYAEAKLSWRIALEIKQIWITYAFLYFRYKLVYNITAIRLLWQKNPTFLRFWSFSDCNSKQTIIYAQAWILILIEFKFFNS